MGYGSHLHSIFIVFKMWLWNSLQWLHVAPFCHLRLAVEASTGTLGSGLI